MKRNPLAESSEAPEDEEVLFRWNHKIKMLLNPVLWGNFCACFGIPAVLLGIGFSFTGNYKVAVLFPAGLIAFFAGIWVIVGIVMDLRGGFFASFIITSKGIHFSSGKTEKKIANAATVIGILAGSTSAAGVGLLARSEQDAFVAWKNLKKVKVRKRLRYIFVREGFGNKPIGLYCTKENFPQVLALVQSKFKR